MQHIYKISNVVTDAFYVGSTSKPKRRKWEHWDALKKGTHHCVALQAAWDAFGVDAFDFAVVEDVPDDRELALIEDTYLLQHALRAHCYNTATSTQRPSSTDDAVRAKIKQSMLRVYADKGRHPRLGTTHTPEAKALMSAKMTGKFAGEKHYRFGKTVADDVRKKIGDAQRGKAKGPRVLTEEGRARIKAAAAAGRYKHEGKRHTEETVAGMWRGVTLSFADGTAVAAQSIRQLRDMTKLLPSTVNNALKRGRPLLKGPYAGGVITAADQPMPMQGVWAAPKQCGGWKNPKSLETREKIRQAGLGKVFSEETRARLRAAQAARRAKEAAERSCVTSNDVVQSDTGLTGASDSPG